MKNHNRPTLVSSLKNLMNETSLGAKLKDLCFMVNLSHVSYAQQREIFVEI